MTTAPAVSISQRDPALLGQTVVVIGGSAGIGLETVRHGTYDIDGGQQLVSRG